MMDNGVIARSMIRPSNRLAPAQLASTGDRPRRASRLLARSSRSSQLISLSTPLSLSILLPLLSVAPAWGQGSEQTRTRSAAPPSQPVVLSPAVRLLRSLSPIFVPPEARAPKSTANSATRSGRRCNADKIQVNGGMQPVPAGAEEVDVAAAGVSTMDIAAMDIAAIAPPQGHGFSLTPYPAIALQLPPSSAQSVVLMLRSESDADDLSPEDYRQVLPLSPPPDNAPARLDMLSLPTGAAGLQPGRRYRWSLVVVCGTTVEPDDPTFTGWLDYQPLSAEQQRQWASLPASAQARWLGDRGYWYDLVPLALETPKLRNASEPSQDKP